MLLQASRSCRFHFEQALARAAMHVNEAGQRVLQRFGRTVTTANSVPEVLAAIQSVRLNADLLSAHGVIRFYTSPARLARLSPAWQEAINRNAIAHSTISALERQHRDMCDAMGAHLSANQFFEAMVRFVELRFGERAAILAGNARPSSGRVPPTSSVHVLAEEGFFGGAEHSESTAQAPEPPILRSAAAPRRSGGGQSARARTGTTTVINAALRNEEARWIETRHRVLNTIFNSVRQSYIRRRHVQREAYTRLRAESVAVVAAVLQQIRDVLPQRATDMRLTRQAGRVVRLRRQQHHFTRERETVAHAAWRALKLTAQRFEHWRVVNNDTIAIHVSGLDWQRVDTLARRTAARSAVPEATARLRAAHALDALRNTVRASLEDANNGKIKIKFFYKKK